METTKATLTSDGNAFHISMPFSKVDREKRLVSGFATLDNVDQSGDVIAADASAKAFKAFRGNIREMHDSKLAVGKMVSFTSQPYYDPATGETYDGIYVTAHVSKGAPTTWEKVLDGTLSGFSVGGNILDAETDFSKSADGSPVRLIKDYELVELSLVDSPCNQYANIFSIEKSNGQTFFKGIAAEVEVSNIYYCETDEIATMSSEDSSACPVCNTEMTNTGWIETAGDVNKASLIKDAIDSYLEKARKVQSNDINEGGIKMEKNSVETEEVADVVEETADVAETVEETAVADEVAVEEDVEKAATVSEVSEPAEPDFAKMLDDLKTYFSETIKKSDSESVDALNKVLDAVAEIEKTVETMKADHESLTKAVADVSGKFESVEKRLGVLDKAFAIKKSEDLGGSSEEETLEKSKGVWGGTFLGASKL